MPREEVWAIPPYPHQYRPGDVVVLSRHTHPRRAVILYQHPASHQACTKCTNPACTMWTNVLTDGGELYFHVGECEMRLHALGKLLRTSEEPLLAGKEESPGAERGVTYGGLGRSPAKPRGRS